MMFGSGDMRWAGVRGGHAGRVPVELGGGGFAAGVVGLGKYAGRAPVGLGEAGLRRGVVGLGSHARRVPLGLGVARRCHSMAELSDQLAEIGGSALSNPSR